MGKRMARLALAGKQIGPQVAGIQRFISPAGMCNAIRARFNGVAGGWVCGDPSRVRGFEVCIPDAASRAPLYVVNAFVDRAAGSDIIVVLNREMDPDTRLGYGLGPNPTCELVDADDTPLLSFLPQPVV